jgi:hypothetical protein
MKKIALFSMALLLTGALGIVLLSSFKGGSVEEEKFSGTTYFKFEESASPINEHLTNQNNWTVEESLPGSNPCNSGTTAPCIIQVDNYEAGIDPESSDAAKKAQLVYFLSNLSGMDAEQFVSTPGNYVYRRQ